MRYVVIIERGDNNYSAYVPDLPGCVATGATPQETLTEIETAIHFHLDGLKDDGLPIPEPTSTANMSKRKPKRASTRSNRVH